MTEIINLQGFKYLPQHTFAFRMCLHSTKGDEEGSLRKKKLNNISCLKTSFKLIMVFYYCIFLKLCLF